MSIEKDELERPTTAPTYKSTTVIKYMATRSLCPNLSNSFQGSLRSFDFFIPSPLTTTHGLASLIENPTPSHDHEHRDLSKLTETLAETILHCCNLDVHNRAQELQIEWLKNNANKNSVTIEKMFRAEIQTGRQLIEDTLRYKSDYNKQLNDIHQSTIGNDQYYQQLLAKRNMIHRELFEYQRRLAQNRAETEFLRIRTQMFNDEMHFYKLKNNTLNARKMKLEYELNEELFGKQILEMECEVLENEKITNEDVHLSSIDDVRGSIDFNQIPGIQPSNYYYEQLNHQIRQLRLEYNKKIQVYRDELHRKYELEAHRYQLHKQRLTPMITKEHLDGYKHDKNEIDQQISAVRGSSRELENQIERFEKQIDQTQITNSQKRLAMLQGIIHEKEQELNAVIRIRTKYKQQIEIYRYSKQKSNLRPSVSQELISTQLITNQPKEAEEGIVVRFTDFYPERDCEELNRIFHESNVNVSSVISILCNRTVSQRLQIREKFRNRFGQNLSNVIDSEMNGNAKKILKNLLLSPIERDCYEFRRVLKGVNIDENILIEIFFSRSNKQIQAVINNYSKLFKTTLEHDITNIKDTPSKQIFLSLLQADRPEDQEINHEKISDDARNLYETNSKWRTDGSTFIELICNRSNEQLKQIFDAYQQFSGIDIEQMIKIDADIELSRTLMAIVRIVRNRTRFFAYELRKSLKSSNMNEDTLNRIIISRCEIDIQEIQSEYEKISKRTLYDQIQTNTNGDYQRAMLELLHHGIEPIQKEIVLQKLLKQSEFSGEVPQIIQWKETDINRIKQFNRFDRNNQAKSMTLSTINPRLSQSQIILQHSNGNYDE